MHPKEAASRVKTEKFADACRRGGPEPNEQDSLDSLQMHSLQPRLFPPAFGLEKMKDAPYASGVLLGDRLTLNADCGNCPCLMLNRNPTIAI